MRGQRQRETERWRETEAECKTQYCCCLLLLSAAGIGDLRSLMKSILSSIETKKNPGAAAASLLDKLSKDKAKEITAHAHPAPDPSEAAAADDSTEATQTEAAEEGDPMQVGIASCS